MNNTTSSFLTDTIQLQRPVMLLFRFAIVLMFLAGCHALVMHCTTEQEYFTGGMGLLCLAIVSIPVFLRRDYSLFEPLTFVLLLVAFGTTLKLFYIISQHYQSDYVNRRLLNFGQLEDFNYGLTIIAVGWVLFIVGYMIRFETPVLSQLYLHRREHWHGIRLQNLLIWLTAFSIICFVAFVVVAGINFSSLESISAKRFSEAAGSSQNRMFDPKYYLYRGASFSKFVVYLSLLWLLYRKQPLLSWVGFLMVYAMLQSFFLSFVISNRAGIVLLLIDCMVISFYMRQRMELRKIFVMSIAAVGLIVLILGLRVRADHSVYQLFEKTMCGRDMLDISKTCHIINGVPDKMDYRNGETLVGWMAAPIPRSIWADKPMWSAGPFINTHIFGDKAGITGIPPGLVAETYWNLGLYGMWLSMFLVGVFLRQMFLAFLRFSTIRRAC